MRLDDKAVNDVPGDEVLEDVVDEHLEELEFCVTRLRRSHEDPLLRLSELARNAEARLLAHVDALIVAGPSASLAGAVRRTEDRDPGQPAWATALGLISAVLGLDELIDELFGHEDVRVRRAAARGCSLAASERLDRVALSRLGQARTPGELVAWLEVAGRRGLASPAEMALVASTEADVVAAALRCLRQPMPSLSSTVERLAEHSDPQVREAALGVALAWGTPRALAICEAQALDDGQAAPLAMVAYGILGGAKAHVRLVRSAASEEKRPHVFRALGFTGSPGLVPALISGLGAKKPLEAKLAAQAIAAITGLDLRRDEFAAKPIPRADSLPPLEEDDLDADLVPQPEDALPQPNVEAISAWCKAKEGELKSSQRLVFGAPWSPGGLLWAMENGPLGLRYGWALAAHLWSGGRFWLDIEALSTVQRRQLSLAGGALTQWSGPAWAADRSG